MAKGKGKVKEKGKGKYVARKGPPEHTSDLDAAYHYHFSESESGMTENQLHGSVDKPGSNSKMTTVMLAGLPPSLTAHNIVAALDNCGFDGGYDFLYVPISFESHTNMGHAFINFTSPESAEKCLVEFSGFAWSNSSRPCRTRWADVQGYKNNIRKQQWSSLIAADIPDDFKPWVFDGNGRRIPPLEIFAPLPGSGRAWQDSNVWQEESWNAALSGSDHLEPHVRHQAWSSPWQEAEEAWPPADEIAPAWRRQKFTSHLDEDWQDEQTELNDWNEEGSGLGSSWGAVSWSSQSWTESTSLGHLNSKSWIDDAEWQEGTEWSDDSKVDNASSRAAHHGKGKSEARNANAKKLWKERIYQDKNHESTVSEVSAEPEDKLPLASVPQTVSTDPEVVTVDFELKAPEASTPTEPARSEIPAPAAGVRYRAPDGQGFAKWSACLTHMLCCTYCKESMTRRFASDDICGEEVQQYCKSSAMQ